MSAYSEKLKDPRWQKKRLEILNRDEWCCQVCFDTSTTLHVHHRDYQRGKEPWDYENHVLVTLCAPCHEIETVSFDSCLEKLGKVLRLYGAYAHDIDGLAEALLAVKKDGRPVTLLPPDFTDIEDAISMVCKGRIA